ARERHERGRRVEMPAGDGRLFREAAAGAACRGARLSRAQQQTETHMTPRSALAIAAAAFSIAAGAQTVNVALNADIRSLNPGVNRDDNTDTVVLHIVEGLVALRENGGGGPQRAGQDGEA